MGHSYLKPGTEFESSLQTWYLRLLKNILGVKRFAPNWAVLRECGQEPLQFYWFRAAVKFYDAMVQISNPSLKVVLCAQQADVRLSEKKREAYTKRDDPFIKLYVGN